MGLNDKIFVLLDKAEDILIDSSGPINRKNILNEATERLVIEDARKMGHGPVKIVVQLSTGQDENNVIESAIRNHFAYCRQKQYESLRHTLKTGWISLLVGFVFLAIMYFIVRLVTPYLREGGFLITIRELFIILGWVALWRPAELLLYEWFPFFRDAKLFSRIQHSEIKIIRVKSVSPGS